uniref:Integrase n=1 Tax=Steinernema glaseri TaxID=37863 RepID=A0A1I8ABW2_9BILA
MVGFPCKPSTIEAVEFYIMALRADDERAPVGAHSEHLDGDADELLHELDVLPAVLRELFVLPHAGGGRLPARQAQ